MSLISIVTPVYYTAASLPDLLNEFQLLSGRYPKDEFEFIFVNDGSGDNSRQVMETLVETEPRMRIVNLTRNFGSIPALLAGLAEARGDAVAAIASDLQDPPEMIGQLLDYWHAGKKVAIAARRGRGDPWLSSALADTFYRLFRRFAIQAMPARGFDFFLIDRQVCNLINNIDENNTYLMGLILWLGFTPAVIYYDRREREKRFGNSKWTFFKRVKYFVDAFVAFSYMPVRAASALGIVLSTLGFIYAIVVIIARLSFGIEIEGWASLMVVLLVVSGAQTFMIGIIGEYLWRTLDETRKRPRYVVDTIVETSASLKSSDKPQRRKRS